MEDVKKAQDLHGTPAPAPARPDNQPPAQAMDVVAPPPQEEGDHPAPAPADQAPMDHLDQAAHDTPEHPAQAHHTEHHGGGPNAAIIATVVIVIVLAVLATYAYMKTQNTSHMAGM